MAPPPLPAPVTIIVPVYNGLNHLKRLVPGLFANTDARHPILFIDDCSSDPEVQPYLHAQAALRPNATVLCAQKNQGFTTTANEGASKAPGHFVLLNSDTEVPPFWLERLMSPLFADEDVASTTPFSNAATIFSFPKPLIDNPEFLQPVCEVDNAFRTIDINLQTTLDSPTAVGFCMGVNGRIWRSIGGFDTAAFGHGYGEENDWCQRARAAGYRNILVPNLYVFHAHGGSFSESQRKFLQSENGRKLLTRWPTYDSQVQEHINCDPWKLPRAAAFLRLCLTETRRPLILFDHAIGGGANHYRNKQITTALRDGRSAVVITYNRALNNYHVEAAADGHFEHYAAASLAELLQIRSLISHADIMYNNLVTWPSPLAAVAAIAELAKTTNSRLVVLIHDYFSVCPSPHLLGANNEYCGIPARHATCAACLPRNGNAGAYRGTNIEEWRNSWQRLIEAATEVRCFSNSSAAIASRVWSVAAPKLSVVPHEPLVHFRETHRSNFADPLVIGAVGSIGLAKGADIVSQMAKLLATCDRTAKLVVIGEFDPAYLPDRCDNLVITGRYEQHNLPQILKAHGVHICVIPSIIPETFSYATQELMALRLPLVSFDLGAPAERIRSYDIGALAQSVSAESMLGTVMQLWGQLQTRQAPKVVAAE
jgi:GT2 family glycosyltransferase